MRIESVSASGSTAVEVASVADRVGRGEIVILRGVLQQIHWLTRLEDLCRDELVPLVGEERTREIVATHFEHIHRQLSVDELFQFNRNVMRKLGPLAPLLIKDFAHQVLGRTGSFAECLPNMRTIVPHDAASEHAQDFLAEHKKRGAGKVSLHGPHYDSWHGHPTNTVNLWCAISHVHDGNGMLVYPDILGKSLPCDDTGSIRRDQVLGKMLNFELNPGDGVMFLANHLHGSEINRTDETRCVISMRMTLEQPAFPGGHRYRYLYTDWVGTPLERWARLPVQLSGNYLRARARGFFARPVKHKTLGGKQREWFPVRDDTAPNMPAPVPVTWDAERRKCFLAPDALAVNEIRPVDRKFCVARTEQGYVLFGRFCPHEHADLAGASINADSNIACPWHNLTFDPKTGQSPCRSIARLAVVSGTLAEGMVCFDLDGAKAAPANVPTVAPTRMASSAARDA